MENYYLKILSKVGKITDVYSSYDQSQREYYKGGGSFYEKEVHLLKYIIDNPTKRITQIAKDMSRTKSSISQIVKRLCDKGLLEIKKEKEDKRLVSFIVTEKGKMLDEAHRRYDLAMANFLSKFLE